jgi:hypothetical protein
MEDLPPAGSRRMRFAVVFWAVFTIVFLGLSGYRLVEWRASGGEFPVLATIGGLLGVIGIWRWIVERTRER